MTDPRLARWQLRKNGELLLRMTPPRAGQDLRPVESQSWSANWGSFLEQHPDLQPRLEHSETFPRERLRDRLGEIVAPDREHVLVVSLPDVPDVVGFGAGCVAGRGVDVVDYVVGLIQDDIFVVHELFVLDEPEGTILLVDQDDEEHPGEVLVQRFRWPEFDG